MLDTVRNSQLTVHPAVRDIVVLLLWGPLVIVTFGEEVVDDATDTATDVAEEAR